QIGVTLSPDTWGPKPPWSRSYLSPAGRFSSLDSPEHEFIAAERSPDRPQVRQRESAIAAEGEDLLGLCYLEWVSSEPVVPIMHHGHAAILAILTVSRRWTPAAAQVGSRISREAYTRKTAEQQPLPDQAAIVQALQAS